MYNILMTTPLLTHLSHNHVHDSRDCSSSDSFLSQLLHYDSVMTQLHEVEVRELKPKY